MNEFKTREPNLDEIMQKIRDEVAERNALSQSGASRAHGEYMHGANKRGIFNTLLWNFGTRYASLIKKIPVVKKLAEKYYWRIANKQSASDTTLGPTNDTHFNLENDLNYRGFLEELRHLGLKGKIKLFIFKFIGFFAWWQEQINAALYREIVNQRAKIEDVNNRLTTISRTEDALYQELTNQKVARSEMDRTILAEIKNQKLIILDQQRRLTLLVEEAEKRLSEPKSGGQSEDKLSQD